MASVRLDFVRPEIQGLVKLHIYEAAVKEGPFDSIEEVAAIGAYPNYISYYTTNLAASADDWFTIAWEDDKGALTPMSVPVQGGTTSVIAQLVNRMLLRDPSLNETIAAQEAEAAVSWYFNVADPYTIDPATITARVMSGLTNLALARSYMTRAITSSQANKWSAGIVSMDTSTGQQVTAQTVKQLLDLAAQDLGKSLSYVLLLKEISVAGGFKRVTGVDLTRSILEIQ